MQRHEAFKLAIDTREEILPLLQFVRAERFIGKEAREAITNVRDVLYASCCFFEEGEAVFEFEDLYLPLFDALSYVTGILHGADWKRWHTTYRNFILTNVARAIETLEQMMMSQVPY